jgi:formate dehydrogenase major subunit
VYSVGWTHHTVGVQLSARGDNPDVAGHHRTAGGGILALRGAASTEGSTDIPTLWQLTHAKTAAAANDPTVFWE